MHGFERLMQTTLMKTSEPHTDPRERREGCWEERVQKEWGKNQTIPEKGGLPYSRN